MENKDTGLLLDKSNILLQRQYFKEMTRLIGINVLYRAPIKGSKKYDGYGELDAFYQPPVVVGCIFDEHPTQWTMKKLGWVSELSENVSVISLPYDLQDLQVGSLIIVPSGIDNAEGRVFKVTRMSTISIYPASITCEIGPMYVNKDEAAPHVDFTNTNFNLLKEEDD